MLQRIFFKPYPITIHLSLKVYYAVGTAFFTAFFLFFVQPFSMTGDISLIESLYLAVYSLCTGLTFFAIESLLPKLLPQYFKDSSWTYLHQFAFSFFVLTGIVFSIFLLQFFSGSSPNVGGVAKYVFTIGTFVVMALTFLDERFLLRQRIAHYNFVALENIAEAKPDVLQIAGQSPKEQLAIHLNAFLYAVADGNYVSVYWMHNEKLERSIIRQTIKTLQEQVADRGEIIQTHRGYLVNKLNIIEITGNRSRMIISLKHISHTVPVSRSFIAKVTPDLKQFLS